MSECNNIDTYQTFLAYHEPQLRASGVPENLWKSLNTKLSNQIFDAGEFFQLLLLDYGDEDRGEKDPVFTVVALNDIKKEDSNAIFLIDHALTFKSDILRKQLVDNPSIVNRLSIMMGLSDNNDIEKVMKNIWRLSNFYSINSQGMSLSVQILSNCVY
jgi:tubulin--tyrosine ligase-like protein 12